MSFLLFSSPLQQLSVSLHLQETVVRRDGVFRSALRGLFWPFGIVVREPAGVDLFSGVLGTD